MLERRVGVVGNCVSGKTTLVNSLQAHGYRAINIPQEHSVSPRFWRRLAPDFLIYLTCTLSTAQKRRQIPWGQETLDAQWKILSEARENADLIIPTDELTATEVLAKALDALGST
ncbi:MAG: hypothetical protein KGZ92_07280 [Firmicutes bacterium]|nr:hypothetical protein [Dethiobacter sp.]MBS3889076.1 hypothetical protein [Bacillota bacterium]